MDIKVKLNGKIYSLDDIADAQFIDPWKYHIYDIQPFLAVTLKNGEYLNITDRVEIVEDE